MNLPGSLRKIDNLGKGSFGEVILCENDYLNKMEAVKIISIDIYNKEQMNNVLFEPLILEYLRHSDYIVKIYDADLLGMEKFIIRMEYLKNGSLESLNILPIRDVLKVGEHISYALEYIHNKSILHLDVKPGNILISDNGGYKLSDFGLSNIKNTEGKSKFKSIYTLHFPPETGDASEQTDVYMFGITLYRLLNGKIHFLKQLKNKGNIKDLIFKGKFPDRNNYLPHIPKKLKAIINKAINKDLTKRFKSIKDFRKALNNLDIKYFWTPIFRKDGLDILECYSKDNKLLYHIECAQIKNNKYKVELVKHNKIKSHRVIDYCYSELSFEEAIKKINLICSEFI